MPINPKWFEYLIPAAILTVLVISVLALSGCSRTAPVSDVSGSGFVLEKPNAWSRENVPKHDPDFAAQVVTNRETCLKLAGCQK